MAAFDILVKSGRVLDPGQQIDDDLDVGVKHGRIAAVEKGLSEKDAWLTLDASGCYVTPGLIDLHTHMYWGGTDLGLQPDPICLTNGVTTAIDAGSAGWANFPGFRHFVIGQARTRVLAFVNISSIGITDMRVGENLNLRYCGVEDCITAIQRNRDCVLGVKVRISGPICGENALEPLRRAAQVRDATGTRLMVHVADSAWPLPEILALLKPGDIVTHCFHGRGQTVLNDQRSDVWPEVRAAQARGVIFDVGHGQGSFSLPVARIALERGFFPNTISTDLHAYSIHQPAQSLPAVMSKFLYLGLSVPQVVAAATSKAAAAIGMADALGHLRTGGTADIAVLRLAQGTFPFIDTQGNAFSGRQHLVVEYTIRGHEAYDRDGKPLRRWYGQRQEKE